MNGENVGADAASAKAESGDPKPKSRILAFAGLNGEWIAVSGPIARPRRTRVAGPSLRVDTPRPPLRTLLLRMRRHGKLAWHRGRARFHAAQRDLRLRMRASAARAVAAILARLDAWIWQPVTWPFRPAQREMLARTVAALSVAIVALGWIAAYNTLAPARAARPPASLQPPAPPKPFAERVVSRALPQVDLPVVAVPLPVPAPNRR